MIATVPPGRVRPAVAGVSGRVRLPGGDVDRNGGDACNDVPRNDGTGVTTKPGTRGRVMLSGILSDSHTGKTSNFHRRSASILALQIARQFPLGMARGRGAVTWTAARRGPFANDQAASLIAVAGDTSEQKSASGSGE